jgi:hypothetical protein
LNRTLAKPTLLLLLSLISLLIVALPSSSKVHGLSSLPVVGVFSSLYQNNNITDLGLQKGQNFAVQVNVTNAPSSYNGFQFALYYDPAYINVTSYELKPPSTFTGLSPYVFPNPYLASSSYNGRGALRLSVVNVGGDVTTPYGTLVNVTFTIVKSGGVSPLVLAASAGRVSPDAGTPGGLCQLCPPATPSWTRLVDSQYNGYEVETSNGYFKNVAGKPGPIASFTISPSNPTQGDSITFNATTSYDPDAPMGALYNGIVEYAWDFGDTSNTGNVTSFSPITIHSFVKQGSQFIGNFSVRLTVIEQDFGFQGMSVQLLTLNPSPKHCVVVDGIITNAHDVSPGANLNFSVKVENAGTFRETYNITIALSPPNSTIAVIPNQTIDVYQIVNFKESIPTSHLLAGVYSVIATIQLSGHQNCASNIVSTEFGIPPNNSAAALLPLVGGVVAVAGILVAVGIFRRSRRVKDEAL